MCPLVVAADRLPSCPLVISLEVLLQGASGPGPWGTGVRLLGGPELMNTKSQPDLSIPEFLDNQAPEGREGYATPFC